MKIIKVTYLIQCSCGTQFSVVRVDNNTVFFECPKCQKKNGINPKEKIS